MQLLTSADGYVSELAFAPDGRALAAAVFGQGPFLWDIPTTAAPKVLSEYRVWASHLTFSPDSSTLSWLRNHKRDEYERDTGDAHETQLLEDAVGISGQAVTGPDDRLVVRTLERSTGFGLPTGFGLRCFTGDDVGSWAERWMVGPDQTTYGILIAGTATERFFTCESSDGLAQGSRVARERLVMRSSLSGQVLATAAVPTGTLDGLAARADGLEVAAFKNSNLVVWRPGEKAKKFRVGTLGFFRGVAYHPSGNHLLAANNDGTIRVFDTSSWAMVKQYQWDIGQLSSVAVSPDGGLAAAGGEKGQVVVWDLDL